MWIDQSGLRAHVQHRRDLGAICEWVAVIYRDGEPVTKVCRFTFDNVEQAVRYRMKRLAGDIKLGCR